MTCSSFRQDNRIKGPTIVPFFAVALQMVGGSMGNMA